MLQVWDTVDGAEEPLHVLKDSYINNNRDDEAQNV